MIMSVNVGSLAVTNALLKCGNVGICRGYACVEAGNTQEFCNLSPL